MTRRPHQRCECRCRFASGFRRRIAIAIVGILAIALGCHMAIAEASDDRTPIRVGGKAFTEQDILVELVAQSLERHAGLAVRRRPGLGGTDICHAALRRGELDIYVEYTGTALVTVLRLPPRSDPGATFRLVAERYRDLHDLEWLPTIGFDNTYALAVRRSTAERLGLRRLSDLVAHVDTLTGGFTPEFAERSDGLLGLHEALGATFGRVIDLDPGLMYDALLARQVDAIAAFATDPRLDPDRMTVLADDLGLFPPYQAAPVVRAETLVRHPQIRDALAELAGTIDAATMRQLNGQVDLHGRSPRDVASAWLDARSDGLGDANRYDTDAAPERIGLLALAVERREQLQRRTLEHLVLVAVGVSFAIAIGLPLGILAERHARLRPALLGGVEVVQTIPSLAMLAFLFAVVGVLGFLPAAIALVLYALLPVVVNTTAGLANVPAPVRLAADAMGMSRRQRLFRVELPIAAPVILAGIRTATVLTVGIATLSTYIGAGGLGDFIARGLARNDARLTLLGAIPAAAMALALGAIIRGIEAIAARRCGTSVRSGPSGRAGPTGAAN